MRNPIQWARARTAGHAPSSPVERAPSPRVEQALSRPVERPCTLGRTATRAEDQVRFVLIVAPAAKRDVVDRRGALLGVRPDVMRLHEGALRTPASGGRDERAPAAIA